MKKAGSVWYCSWCLPLHQGKCTVASGSRGFCEWALWHGGGVPPAMRLKSADLPTLGRPTMATFGRSS